MKNLFEIDEWKIVERGFSDSTNEIAESITSLANGHIGMRGNFEEQFAGNTLKGTYIAGVYYPDKTRVGWWKIGYPEYFAKILNACDFLSLNVVIDDETLDINKCEIKNFVRSLDMKNGILTRSFELITKNKKKVNVESIRFTSMDEKEIGAIKYSITPIDCDIKVAVSSIIDGDVRNKDSNYDEMFWEKQLVFHQKNISNITMSTKKTEYFVSTSIFSEACVNNIKLPFTTSENNLYIATDFKNHVSSKESFVLYKYFSVTTSRDYDKNLVSEKSVEKVKSAQKTGFDKMLKNHKSVWEKIWSHSDIKIFGDKSAQQGIRFNIFQLNQTYTGDDSRLNIGPKGFTGEKYGGSTYWDTEAYCVPFFLSTAHEDVTKNLLLYRYNHLEKAKENAAKLGLKGALYPMVTMNGEECHNEWEITFEEIHRNAAITHAIYNYVNYTGDESYLIDYGIYVLYETARFWASRVTFNPRLNKYMILGVTGPNEYDNNVNNNYHTNYMAAFSLKYTVEVVTKVKNDSPEQYAKAMTKLHINQTELDKFTEISEKMYYPYIEEYNVFAQQDGYMDKEQLTVEDLLPEDRPINQNWSWDKILRSCFIKQADVLQSIYNLPFEYDIESKKRNFDFYEPKTVHESSLSPCIYSIIASEIGYHKKAYELYLRASRLDLDNYNNDTEDGLHITSMAGTWLSIVHGFGGLRIKDNDIHLSPSIPDAWDKYSFKLYFRGKIINVTISKESILIKVETGDTIDLFINNKPYKITNIKEIKI